MRCSNCYAEISPNESTCPVCGQSYNIDNNFKNYESYIENSKAIQGIGKLYKIFYIIILIPFLLISISFLCVGIYCIVDERNETKNYEETVGTLAYFDYSESGYTGVYEYTVNDTTYTVSPKRISEKSDFKEKETVKYNPEHPEQAIIYAKWELLIIVGIVFSTFFIILLFRRKKSIK